MNNSWYTLAFIATNFVVGQVQLANLTTLDGFSSTCIQVLNQQVNCNSSLLWAGKNGRFETDDTLNYLCTADCSSALSTYMRRISGACGTSRYNGGDGYDYLAGYNGELVYERYQTLCLSNSHVPQTLALLTPRLIFIRAGQLCNQVLRSAAGINPANQQSTAAPSKWTALPIFFDIVLTRVRSKFPLQWLRFVHFQNRARNAARIKCRYCNVIFISDQLLWGE